MEKIRVDFNRRNGRGELVTSLRRATAPLVPGDLVVAYQPGEPEMDSTAEVISVENDGRVTVAVVPAASLNEFSSFATAWAIRQYTSVPPRTLPFETRSASTTTLEAESHVERELVRA